MAVATSDTSARVGTGAAIIDSSICVATTTALPPLRSEIGPPTMTVVSAKSAPWCSTRSRSLPSSSSSSVPTRSAAKISGCSSGARVASPLALSMSRRNGAPAVNCALPPLKVPSRSFGPCRSSSTPIGRPNSASILRIVCSRCAWSDCVPWLKLRRKTSTPHSNKARIAASSDVAGPRVATMRARRSLFMLIPSSQFEQTDPAALILHRAGEQLYERLDGVDLRRRLVGEPCQLDHRADQRVDLARTTGLHVHHHRGLVLADLLGPVDAVVQRH